MGFVQYFVTVLLSSAALVLTSPRRTQRSFEKPKFCPPGTFLKTDTECEPCGPESFTSEPNREDSCYFCFRDCRATNHLRVAQNCTRTSDLSCVCETGFRCTAFVSLSNNCKTCEPENQSTTETTTRIISGKKTTTTPSSSLQTKACVPPKCGPRPDSTTAHPDPVSDNTTPQLEAVLILAVFFGCVFLVILICVCQSRDETCFRQTIAKLCNQERQNTQKLKEPSHQFPRNSFSAKQQLSSPSATNLGPVHVHNPGTVIFSLLSHFAGQVGSTVPNGKTSEAANNEQEDERDCPVFHPTSSPSVHFSEEERSGEIDNVFFPLQEQGKDCHVSKEEVL